ncbi:MAG: ATP-binding cassette domain-containing protein [Burkholderiaceae bacterium]
MNTPFPYRTGKRLLTIENVCVAFDKPVLTGVQESIDNLIRDDVAQGQAVCLLGPSGIGKTQLFRCIAGLQQPTSGGVFLNGLRTAVTPGEVGVVAQNYPLLNHRTVLGNLVIAARTKLPSEKAAVEKSMQTLDEFGLSEKALCYPAALSGGQRQRIAIAQQLLCSSHFLLMDEPFSGLDPQAKAQVCDAILKVSRMDELNTIIVVTHDIEASICIADTLWLLGRDFDVHGKALAGAKIKYKYDLIERGLAWHEDIDKTPEFFELSKELKQRFSEL